MPFTDRGNTGRGEKTVWVFFSLGDDIISKDDHNKKSVSSPHLFFPSDSHLARIPSSEEVPPVLVGPALGCLALSKPPYLTGRLRPPEPPTCRGGETERYKSRTNPVAVEYVLLQ